MGWAGWELQQAVVSALAADAGTSSYTVVDNKKVSALPFVAVGRERLESATVNRRTAVDRLDQIVEIIEVYASTSATCKQYMDNIDDAIRDATYSLTGWTVVGEPFLIGATVEIATDAGTGEQYRVGTLSYRFRVQES